MRLDKYLADMKVGSRSEVKEYIRKGYVRVDGKVIKDAGYQIKGNEKVLFDEEEITYVEYEYYLLNKPAGYVCTLDTSPNVMELIEGKRKDLFPVGRLDKDTEGLLLITNDGQLSHQLISPKKHVDKKYYVVVDHIIPWDINEKLEKGIDLGDFVTLPAHFETIDEYSGYMTVQEGKYHQVKRMMEYFNCHVDYLRRVQFAFLDLEGLEAGEYRELSEDEVKQLKNL